MNIGRCPIKRRKNDFDSFIDRISREAVSKQSFCRKWCKECKWVLRISKKKTNSSRVCTFRVCILQNSAWKHIEVSRHYTKFVNLVNDFLPQTGLQLSFRDTKSLLYFHRHWDMTWDLTKCITCIFLTHDNVIERMCTLWSRETDDPFSNLFSNSNSLTRLTEKGRRCVCLRTHFSRWSLVWE